MIARAATFLAWSVCLVLVGAACGSSNADCTCVVDSNGERRTLACGETACVGGVQVACGDQNKTVTRGPCNATTGPDNGGTGDDASTAPPDTSCSDLSTFCTTACNSPATVAADCLATASGGDPDSCRNWQATNSILCRP